MNRNEIDFFGMEWVVYLLNKVVILIIKRCNILILDSKLIQNLTQLQSNCDDAATKRRGNTEEKIVLLANEYLCCCCRLFDGTKKEARHYLLTISFRRRRTVCSWL